MNRPSPDSILDYQNWARYYWPDYYGDPREGLIHALMGLTTEVGEVVDLFKKPWFTPKRVDGRTHVDLIELEREIGDVLYYLAILADMNGLDMASVIETNVIKLENRHGKKGEDPSSSGLEVSVVENLHGAV